ncbi:synaptonemal complex protein 2 [Aquarana catesbeiana]
MESLPVVTARRRKASFQVWFEMIRDILMCAGGVKSEPLLNLTEDYFNVIMVVHDHSSDGKIQILEHFIVRICSLVSEAAINISIKQEAMRKLNIMLDSMPRETRRKLILADDMMAIMSAMGKRILDAGDYDLQVAITEALFRMTLEAQRVELANHWFPMEFVSNAFKKIKASEFETDCRKFLNLVNGMLGDKRRVFTFPCLAAHLENHKLQTPSDEKLEEFWIDFNVGTESLSFYVSTDDEDHQWETVCVTENEVALYNIEVVGNKILLTVTLNTPATVGQLMGSCLRIFFDSALDITNVVRKVFGAHKFKGFIKKQGISVAKTTVHVIFDESGSQILIPESQESVSSTKHITVVETSEVKTKNQPCLTTPSSSQQNCEEDNSQNCKKLVTPSRPKVSEPSINILVPGAQKTASASVSVTTPSLGKARMKPPLEMISSAQTKTFVGPSHKENASCLKKGASNKQKPTAADVETMLTDDIFPNLSKGGHEEQMDIVPDTQFPVGKNMPILPGLSNTSMSLTKKPEKAVCQNEKASVTNEFLSNKDKSVSDLLAKMGKSSAFQSKTSAQNKKPTGASCPSTKSQAQERCKNKKAEKTKAEEQAIKRQNLNVKKPDISLNTQSRETDVHSHGDDPAKTSDNNSKKESAKVAKFKSSDNAAKKKESSRPKNEKPRSLHDATQSLLAKIGSKYSCDVVNKKQAAVVWQNINDHSTQKNKGKRQNKVKLKEKGELNKIRKGEPWDDIYSFQSAEGDNPRIELGVASTFLPKPTTSVSMTSNESTAEKKQKSTTVTKQKAEGPHRHLFSDTDTDRGGDDTKTDHSWLRNTASKKKPKIVGYSRQKQTKPPKQTVACRAEEIPEQNRKRKASSKETVQQSTNKEVELLNKVMEHKRPQRGGAVKRKCYKEVSDSESESEDPTPPVRKETPRDQYEFQSIKKKVSIEIPQKPENLIRKNQKPEDSMVSSKLDKTPYKMPTISPISSSPESIEQVRAQHLDLDTGLPVKNATFTLLPSSPSPCSSPLASPNPVKSLSIATAVKNVSKHWASTTDKTGNKLGVYETVQENLSPAISNTSMVSLPLDTSTVSGINFLDVRDPDYNEQCVSTPPVTVKARLQSHTLTLKKNSCASYRSGSVVKKTTNVTHTTFHESGPAKHKAVSDLRHNKYESSHFADHSTEESVQGTKHRKIRLLPRRLFPATGEKEHRGSLSISSGKDESIGGLNPCDRSDPDVGLICQKVGKEYTRKIQDRSRKMDYFTEQSVKSAQKHLTTVEVQAQQYRMKHLEKFQQTILEEIENFEKDSKALKQMEKEFTNFWSQQTQVLSVYHSNEQKRIHCLKASFEKNVSHCTNFEGKIFTSEMHVMKEDMKNVQELLLKKMHEEDLLSVRRGLESLFMAGSGPF